MSGNKNKWESYSNKCGWQPYDSPIGWNQFMCKRLLNFSPWSVTFRTTYKEILFRFDLIIRIVRILLSENEFRRHIFGNLSNKIVQRCPFQSYCWLSDPFINWKGKLKKKETNFDGPQHWSWLTSHYPQNVISSFMTNVRFER